MAEKLTLQNLEGKEFPTTPKKRIFLYLSLIQQIALYGKYRTGKYSTILHRYVKKMPQKGKVLIALLERAFNGEGPNDFIDKMNTLSFHTGEKSEELTKAYKWIWGARRRQLS